MYLFALVAQLDRVAVFETEGWEFESLQGRQIFIVPTAVGSATNTSKGLDQGSIPKGLPFLTSSIDIVGKVSVMVASSGCGPESRSSILLPCTKYFYF